MNIQSCHKCKGLQTDRKVIGRGSRTPKVLFIGEAPGYEEWRAETPFVGPAGKLLDEWIKFLGLKEGEYAITNCLKCRPPQNRDPTKEEIENCKPFLNKQLDILNPDIVVPVGKFAMHYFLPDLKSIMNSCGRFYKTIYPVIHPAYYLRNNNTGWKGMLSNLKARLSGEEENIKKITVDTKEKFKEMIKDMEYKILGFDTETTGLNITTLKIVGMSFYAGTGKAYYVPLGHFSGTQLDLEDIRGDLNELFFKSSALIAHNIVYDSKVMKKYGFDITNLDRYKWFDTMVAAHLCYEERVSRGLKHLAKEELGMIMKELKNIGDINNIQNIPIEVLADYACDDAIATYKLYKIYKEELEEKKVDKLFYEIEMPFLRVLQSMEENGVILDVEKVKEIEIQLLKDIKDMEQQIVKLAKVQSQQTLFGGTAMTIDIDSPQQLADLLYRKLNLPVLDSTPSGKPKTDINVLKRLKDKHPVVSIIIKYKEARKMLTSFVISLPKKVDADGRIRTSFRDCGTKTGRLSCVPLRSRILTKKGWKKYNELILGQEVMGYDILTDTYKWTKLNNIHTGEDYTGMIKINNGHDNKYKRGVWCTGNHKWVIRHPKIKGFIETNKSNRNVRKLLQPKVKFPAPSKSILSPYHAALLGWFLTDGYAKDTGKRRALEITLVKGSSIRMLENTLKEGDYTQSKYKLHYKLSRHYKTRFYIGPDVFYSIYLIFKKYSPSELIMGLSLKAREEMFAAMLEADGSRRRNKKRYDRFGVLKNCNKNTLKYFKLLSVSLGQSYTFDERKLPSTKPFVNFQLLKEELLSNKNYKWKAEKKEKVWCPQTECGTWVMEQDGWVVITGNSDNPNLQQLPNNDVYSIRSCFKASPGMKMIVIDYSQEELRMTAHLTQDVTMLDVYKQNKDLHLTTANKVFKLGLKEDELLCSTLEYELAKEKFKKERHSAKFVSFGLLYGAGHSKIGQLIGCSDEEAKRIVDEYFKEFPNVKEKIDEITLQVKKDKFVTNMFGRRRNAKEITNKSYRQLWNFMIQGSCADLLRKAMVELYKFLDKGDAKILLTVHDEIVFEVPEDKVEYYSEELRRIMEGAVKLSIPLIADVGIGDNYAEAK